MPSKPKHVHRRHLLQAGMLGSLGLVLPDWLSASRLTNRRPKSCIFLFMWGGPSQLDTFDLKPHAPAEVRGEFQPCRTTVPGIHVAEHFQQLATRIQHCAIIRSLNHDDPAHLSSGHAMSTGHLAPVIKSDATPPSEKDSPHLGAVLSRIRGSQGTGDGLPPFVMMPWKAFHPAAPGGEAPGQHGGWLGKKYDPLLLTGDPNHPAWKPPVINLPDALTTRRLEDRFDLLRELDAQRASLAERPTVGVLAQQQQQAIDLLVSPRVRTAFDLSREPASIRERYGRNIHGQAVLLARRLVEQGVPLVTVNWHNDGKNFWDTHGNNFQRLKQDLIPPADQALSALIDDLQQRGLFDDTLIVWVGEFGRRPQISKGNSGREHWPYCYSGLLAGGGIAGGAVYGASDALGAYPEVDPVSPADFATTILCRLGVPQDAVLLDREGRPHRVCAGKPLTSLFV